MNKIKQQRQKCKCNNPHCGYEWESRLKQKPKACPRCKRYDWEIIK